MVMFFDFLFDEKFLERDSLHLLHKIRPNWNSSEISFKIFSEGLSNKLIGAFHKDDPEKDDGIVFRVFGVNTEVMIDREREESNMVNLHKAGQGPPLLAKFNNGIAYGFVSGMTLNMETLRDKHIGRLVAKAMIQMHKLRTEGCSEPPRCEIFELIRKFYTLQPTEFTDAKAQQRFLADFKPVAVLKIEMDSLLTHLETLGSPVVYGHNDLLPNNIIHNKKKDKVTFIDYEYGCFTYEAFDIADHFQEFCGVDNIDYSIYPDKTFQSQWLRTYLEEKYEDQGRSSSEVTDYDVEKLYVQVNHFVLAAHFMWGLWALIQAKYSLIEFDYFTFGKLHFDEYFHRKEEFLALKMPSQE